MTRSPIVRHPIAMVGLVLALGLATASLVVAPAVAVRRAETTTIELRGQPPWSTLGDDVTFRLGVRADQPGLEVQVLVHSAVLSRIAFERTLDGDRLGSVLASRTTPLDTMAVVGTDRIFTLGLQTPGTPRDPSRVNLGIPGASAAGVFPVEVQLLDGETGAVLDSFVTSLVAVRPRAADDEPPSPSLKVAWLWQIAASPATNPYGAVAPSFTAAIAPRGRLNRIAEGLTQATDLPITLVPNPETVAALLAADDPRADSVLAAIRSKSNTSPVIASPYITLDAPALARAGLGPALSNAIALGRSKLESVLDAAVDGTIAPTQPLDGPTLTHLRTVGGTTRLVVHPRSLVEAPGPDQFTAARPFKLDTPAGIFDAVEINPTASALLVRHGPAALRAQQILAELSVIALEQPNRVRGVVINTPLLWNPDVARVTSILSGLRDHPLLAPTPISDLFAIPPTTIDGEPYVRALAPIVVRSAPVTEREFVRSRREVDALASMIGDRDPLVTRLRGQLDLMVAGRVPETGRSESLARIGAISEAVGAITSGVTAPASRTVQLTSRQASVPLSIDNGTGRTIRVQVTLESQKLDFPEGSSQAIELIPGKNTTTNFDVEAKASGTFPVLVTLSSPDRGLDLQRARYTVRSSVVSGVGLVLTVSAGLFLAVWWLTHWRRSRRPRATTA